MKLRLEITMDNAAFGDESDRDRDLRAYETWEILHKQRRKIEQVAEGSAYENDLFDSNGNRVGRVWSEQ